MKKTKDIILKKISDFERSFFPPIEDNLEYEINKDVKLKYDKERNKTIIYVHNKEVLMCKKVLGTLGNIENVKSIDDFIKKNKPVREKNLISPKEEFWGHCSNIQVWFENDLKPELIHSLIAKTLLGELSKFDLRYFEKFLIQLNKQWKKFKNEKRKRLFADKYKLLILRCIRNYNNDINYEKGTIEYYIFVRKVVRGLVYSFNKGKRAYEEHKRIKRIKEKKNRKQRLWYHERKIWGKTEEAQLHRKKLRLIRNNDDTVCVSNPEEYPSLMWSVYKQFWFSLENLSNRHLTKQYAPENATHFMIIDSWGLSAYGGVGAWNTEDFHRGWGKVIFRLRDGSYKKAYIRLSMKYMCVKDILTLIWYKPSRTAPLPKEIEESRKKLEWEKWRNYIDRHKIPTAFNLYKIDKMINKLPDDVKPEAREYATKMTLEGEIELEGFRKNLKANIKRKKVKPLIHFKGD